MEEYNLRFMQIEDIPKVCELEKLCFTLPWSYQSFHTELTQNLFAKYLVIEMDDRIISYGGMWIIVDEAHVTNVAVHPNYRGRKLGELMMLQMMELARGLHAVRITLEVRPSNTVARALYQKLGFVDTGVRPGYYTDNNEDAIIMWTDL